MAVQTIIIIAKNQSFHQTLNLKALQETQKQNLRIKEKASMNLEAQNMKI